MDAATKTTSSCQPGNRTGPFSWPVQVVQHNPDCVRPVWPVRAGEQQMMLHLDFEVADLDAEVARAVGLGAELPEHQPQEKVRVLLDPAGHHFCLYVS